VLCSVLGDAFHFESVPNLAARGQAKFRRTRKAFECASVRFASAKRGGQFPASARRALPARFESLSRSTRANSSLYSAGFSAERISSSRCAQQAAIFRTQGQLRPATRRRCRQSRSPQPSGERRQTDCSTRGRVQPTIFPARPVFSFCVRRRDVFERDPSTINERWESSAFVKELRKLCLEGNISTRTEKYRASGHPYTFIWKTARRR